MTRPKAIIAEDEPLLRQELRNALHSIWPQLEICCEVEDGAQAVAAFERYAPQILFLDIQMPGLTGLEVAERASARAHVVFVTAFDQFAVDAFERGALDYVLKPLTIPRLQLAVTRLRERLGQPPSELQGLIELLRASRAPEQQYVKWLTVPDGDALRVVTADEILFLQSDNKYTTLATRGGTYLLTSTLKQLREKLDPQIFWQIHRGIIINMGAIDTLYRSFKGSLEVKMKGRDELLPVSATHARLFRQL